MVTPYVEPPQPGPPRDWLRGCLIVGLLMLVPFAGCMTIAAGGAAYYAFNRTADVVPDAPKPIAGDLTDQLRGAMTGPLADFHAEYFGKLCDGVANRLEADGHAPQPIYDTRTEAANLIGQVGQLATLGNDANYPALPAVIVSAFDGVFPESADGRLEAGPLTTADRAELVRRWRSLSQAFKAL